MTDIIKQEAENDADNDNGKKIFRVKYCVLHWSTSVLIDCRMFLSFVHCQAKINMQILLIAYLCPGLCLWPSLLTSIPAGWGGFSLSFIHSLALLFKILFLFVTELFSLFGSLHVCPTWGGWAAAQYSSSQPQRWSLASSRLKDKKVQRIFFST